MNETDVIQIKVRDGDTINLSLHSDGIWLSLFKQMSYASTMLTMKQTTELRDAINKLLEVDA
jgi:hypothetical protein